MKTIFEDLHDKYCTYTPNPEHSKIVYDSHQALISELSKEHRKLVLKIIDSKDMLYGEYGRESFMSGFLLAWQILTEFNMYKNGRLFRELSKQTTVLLCVKKILTNKIAAKAVWRSALLLFGWVNESFCQVS